MSVRIVIVLVCFGLMSCGSADVSEPNSETKLSAGEVDGKSPEGLINLSVLWDLSDRLDPSKDQVSPPHFERDIEVIRSLTEAFRLTIKALGAYKAKSKIRVFFTPTPAGDQINEIAKSLKYDLSAF